MTDFSSGLSQAVQEGDDKRVVQLVKEALAEGFTEDCASAVDEAARLMAL